MQEYNAVRGDILTSRSNQVAILSFGVAAVGLLVSAAATLWNDAAVLAGLLLLFVVPVVSFLALVIYEGEMIRLMRAGLFINYLENWVNEAPWQSKLEDEGGGLLLTWEQWRAIRGVDVQRYTRMAIPVVFCLLAFGFMMAGYLRLRTATGIDERWLTLGLIGTTLVTMTFIGYILYVARAARSYTYSYTYTADRAVYAGLDKSGDEGMP
jgi:hypothetical protein